MFSLKKIIPIFMAAFITGMILSIAVISGIKPTEGGITLFFLKSLCSTEEYLDGYSCESLIIIMTFISVIGLICSIITHIKGVGNWKVGIIVYAIGWFLGFLSIILFL